MQVPAIDFYEYTTDELTALQAEVTAELEHRTYDQDLAAAKRVELVNGEFVSWRALSAHPNLKAVKPWILHVTDTHEQYGVDGDWCPKQQIDGTYHVNIEGLSEGDIIKVSGASYTNRKHRYYRIIAVTDDALYYEPTYGLDEATVIEEVA
jgi:hypothetical protein